MNCKQGDLAVVVRAFVPANLGRFVTVLEPLGNLHKGQIFEHDGKMFQAVSSGFYWWVESSSLLTIGGTMTLSYQGHISDAQLRAIRDGEGNESWHKAAPIPKVLEAA